MSGSSRALRDQSVRCRMEEVRKKQRKEEKRKGGGGGAPAVKQRKDLVVSWRSGKIALLDH